MPGRLVTQGILQSNGTSGQKYVYVAIQLDQDYDVQSVGFAPDPSSQAGQWQGHIGSFRGPMPAAVTKAVSGPNKTDFSGNFALQTTFGPEVERLIGDLTDQANLLTPIYVNSLNPKFYNRMPRLRQNTWLVILGFDSVNGDSVTRTLQYELIMLPVAGDESPGQYARGA